MLQHHGLLDIDLEMIKGIKSNRSPAERVKLKNRAFFCEDCDHDHSHNKENCDHDRSPIKTQKHDFF